MMTGLIANFLKVIRSLMIHDTINIHYVQVFIVDYTRLVVGPERELLSDVYGRFVFGWVTIQITTMSCHDFLSAEC